MKTPFWETSYQDDDVSAFGTKPNAFILKYEHLFQKSWKVLDIGCGEGQNALHFARRGFPNVDAFDLSEHAIAKLRRIAEKSGLQVSSWVQDLCEFRFIQPYDLIVSFGTLHFVEKEEWNLLLRNAKEHTNVGGIHIIQIFTNVLPASPDIASFAIGLADDRELEVIYQDWEILEFNSYTFEDEHPGAAKHIHASNKIVARCI